MGCLFCKIVSGEIPSEMAFENSDIIVIHDIKPQAPIHMLIIPKRHIATINDTDSKDEQLLGRMILTAKKIAKTEKRNDDGYRLVFNVNFDGGQEIYHIHLHLLGGRRMTWPPG
jgi:histidine triad (HIT) family protein